MKENKNVDIIIPIYNAYEDLKLCLESIYKFTNLQYHRLILINDNSPDERIRQFLDGQQREGVIVIHNSVNKGFSNNINIGMAQSDNNDVILLNSDTVVTENWVEKLLECAYSDKSIGTVTPVSNNATLCSVPQFCEENTLNEGMSIDDAGEIVERCSFKAYPRITVAHGFCMLVKREVIDCIGNFDAETFGRGYGEENDFCNRAEQAGYHHVMCDNTYIYHSGTKSFISKEKEEYIKAHERILRERYPEQMHQNDIHCRDNPNYFIGENISIYFDLCNGKINILYVLQSDFREGASDSVGGTQFHVRDLTNGLREKYNVFVAARDKEFLNLTVYFGQREKRFRFFVGEKKKIYEFTNNIFDKLWRNILSAFRIDLIHIHHVISTSFDIFYVAREYKIPIIFTAHDFYFICPSIRLLDYKHHLCIGKSNNEICKKCLNESCGITDKIDYINLWRKKCLEILEQCEQIITPNQSAKDIILRYYPSLENKLQVIAHGYKKITFKDQYNIESTNDVIYNFEEVKKEGFSYKIRGWAYLREEERKNNKIFLLLKNQSGDSCIIPTSKIKRMDVNSGSPDDEVGFSGIIPEHILDGNEIEVRIAIEKNNTLQCAMESYKTICLKKKGEIKLNIAFLGGISIDKGGEKICSIIKSEKESVNWHVFGNIGVKELEDLKQNNFIKTGGYNPEDLHILLKEHRIDVIGILSIWPETYSYTVTEAILNGIPVVVSDIGALGRRVKEMQCGWTIPVDSMQTNFLKIINEINLQKNILKTYKERVNEIHIASIDQMVCKYFELYEKVGNKEITYEEADFKFIFDGFMSKNRNMREEYCMDSQQFEALKQELSTVYSSPSYKIAKKIWTVPFPGRQKVKTMLIKMQKKRFG